MNAHLFIYLFIYLFEKWSIPKYLTESKLSQSTYASSSTASQSDNSDLLEIVEVDSSGHVSKVSKVRTNESFGTHGKDEDWTAYSSESELEPTDDEYEETVILKRKVT